jgi:hypothetical protein
VKGPQSWIQMKSERVRCRKCPQLCQPKRQRAIVRSQPNNEDLTAIPQKETPHFRTTSAGVTEVSTSTSSPAKRSCS